MLEASLIKQTLASWRFFLLFSLPPFIWALFIVPNNILGGLVLLLCGVVWIKCWRLWLDEHYFRLINEGNNELAGDVLYLIWGRDKLQRLSFIQRQQGALTHFRHTMWLSGMV